MPNTGRLAPLRFHCYTGAAYASPIPLSSFAAHFASQILTSWQQLSYCFDGFGQKLAYALDKYAVISMGNIDGVRLAIDRYF